MSNFVGFKDGNTFVFDEYIEAVRLVHPADNDWRVTVYLRYPDGGKSEYSICQCNSESEAKKRLDSFMAVYSNVKHIE